MPFRAVSRSGQMPPAVALASAAVVLTWTLGEAGVRTVVSGETLVVLMTLSIFATVMTAWWLVSQAHLARDGSRAVLGAFLACVAGSTLLYAVLVPGIAPTAAALLHATPQAASYLYFARPVCYALGVAGYHAWSWRFDAPAGAAPRRQPAFAPLVAAIVAAWAVLAGLALWVPGLPQLIGGGRFSALDRFVAFPIVIVALVAAGALPFVRRRFGVRLELWLSATCFALGFGLAVVDAGGAPYTRAWYVLRVVVVLAQLAILAVLLFESLALERELARRAERLEAEANHDHLTGLPNRRFFEQHAGRALAQDRRLDLPTALAVIDIDHFKAYNDGFGHAAGDVCLRRVAAAIAGSLWRPGDFVARLGGEEFVIVFAVTDAVGAMLVLERIRAALERASLAMPNGRAVTVSAGVAQARVGESYGQTLERADAALYRAKQSGRNRAESAEPIDIESLFGFPIHAA